MENFLYYNNNSTSNPNSVNSSPRSRDIDLDYSSPWDEQQQQPQRHLLTTTHKVKFLCSYGGRIQLRPHDNQLTYVGGDTKIFAVDRNVKFNCFITKLVKLCGVGLDACFKYQLPGEDLDSLISVTNDEDLEHMMLEYDRIYRVSAKPARLRLFIFTKIIRDQPELESESEIYRSDDSKGSIGQWYVDVLNGLESSGSPRVEKKLQNPDYLFGLEKGESQPQPNSLEVAAPPKVMMKKEFEDEKGYVIGGSPVKKGENIQRQRMQISSNNEDYYRQNDQFQPGAPLQTPAAAGYWQERNEFFPAGANVPPQQPVYFVQTPAGVYQAPGQVNRAYYGGQGMVPGLVNYDSLVQKAPSSPVIQRPHIGGAAYPAAMIGLSQPNGVVEGGGGGGGGFTHSGHKPVAGRDDYYHFP